MRNKSSLPLMPKSELESVIDWVKDHHDQIRSDAQQGNQEARKVTVLVSWLTKFSLLPAFDNEDCSHCATLLKEQIEVYKATDWLPLLEQDDPLEMLAKLVAEALTRNFGGRGNTHGDIDSDTELQRLMQEIDTEE